MFYIEIEPSGSLSRLYVRLRLAGDNCRWFIASITCKQKAKMPFLKSLA